MPYLTPEFGSNIVVYEDSQGGDLAERVEEVELIYYYLFVCLLVFLERLIRMRMVKRGCIAQD